MATPIEAEPQALYAVDEPAPDATPDDPLARQAVLVVRAFALCLEQLAGTEPLALRVDIAIRLAAIVVKG